MVLQSSVHGKSLNRKDLLEHALRDGWEIFNNTFQFCNQHLFPLSRLRQLRSLRRTEHCSIFIFTKMIVALVECKYQLEHLGQFVGSEITFVGHDCDRTVKKRQIT
uniref:AsIV-cont00103-ORF2 n=1 Tax=Apophua simplicipes ichnovirus TaxID=1329648 RepID=S5DRB6_9VIRU|nr:AsIV-cont00103-ORF2 [Apophua simplicipes ichnovirus]